MNIDLITELNQIIKSHEFCVLITNNENSAPSARLMQVFRTSDELDFYFGISPNSRKAREIKKDNSITLIFFDQEVGAYASISGKGYITDSIEMRKKYWKDYFIDFWKDGPEGNDYVVLKVIADKIEMMNASVGIAPEPYGLKPLTFVKKENNWIIKED